MSYVRLGSSVALFGIFTMVLCVDECRLLNVVRACLQGLFNVLLQGVIKVGSLEKVWTTAEEGGRIQFLK